MAHDQTLSIETRAAGLAALRAPFHARAQDIATRYGMISDESPEKALEQGANILWLQSITNGNESYSAYLVSPLWQMISREVLHRDGFKCTACWRDAEIVHHRSYEYEVMAGHDDSKLVSLCHPCHRYIHHHETLKLPMVQWDRRLRELQKFFTKKRKKRKPQPEMSA